MRALVLFSLTAFLVGCATTAERSAQAQRDVEEMMQVYGPACEKLGYKAGADPWRECVLRLSAKDSLERGSRYPSTTTCFGSRGFFSCNSF